MQIIMHIFLIDPCFKHNENLWRKIEFCLLKPYDWKIFFLPHTLLPQHSNNILCPKTVTWVDISNSSNKLRGVYGIQAQELDRKTSEVLRRMQVLIRKALDGSTKHMLLSKITSSVFFITKITFNFLIIFFFK